ncbi:holocytochrome c synthase [Dinochytrium kinnereticum]|nr:holocytochrome c synthase [Dinochytrium kinnereticum]
MDKKSECPVDHSAFAKKAQTSGDAQRCAYAGAAAGAKGSSELNPLNMIPHLSDEMAPGQKAPLSKEREKSTIPKNPSSQETWEYPSPQGFYNALKRKGWETPEGDIPTMVAIHNFLNEACWGEILKWEEKYHCDCKDITLKRFQGRPQDLSPKAWFMGKFYGAERPFDRHDWTVNRCGKDVRYVIDYYSGHDEPGNPAFNVDVRPALDSPSAIWDRAKDAVGGWWSSMFSSGN